ncbi:MAG: peptidoglycan bridge formation glycyltransferase FemA/FemB family protein [Patescibacteria group bacterium]
MTLTEIQNEHDWDAFVSAQKFAQFTQSWAWGEFQRGQGKEVRRLGMRDIVAAQFIRQPGRFGVGYWFASRGPVFATETVEEQKEGLSKMLLQAQHDGRLKGRALFVRMEPVMVGRADLSGMGLIRTHAFNPATTLVLDLQRTEEELLADMHPKTRYNIRVAEKHGVTVREGVGEEDLACFLDLMDETAKRDGFRPLSRNYLAETYRVLAKTGLCRLRLAEFQGKVLAANMEMAFGDTATYLHGASSSAHRNVMAPYALQWEAIRAARIEGRHFYDFWGCNPEDEEDPYFKPRWQGITRFKRGWGGLLVDFVGTWDLPRWEWAYRKLFPKH